MTPPQFPIADDIRAIEQAKYQYVRGGDTHDWALLRSVMHDDFEGVWDQGFSVQGADAFMELSRKANDGLLVCHTLHHPEITVTGDRATGIWVLNYRALRKTAGTVVEGAGHYYDEYRRSADGRWLIYRVELQRLYEFEQPLDALPSFRVTADRHGG